MQKKTGKIIKDPSALGQLGGAIEQICEEKGLEKAKVMESIEAALSAAYKKDYGKKGQVIAVSLDEKTGDVSFKQLKEVVDDTTRDPDSIELYKNGLLAEEERRDWKEIIGEQSTGQEEDFEEDHLAKFNGEKDILVEDAQKIDPNLKVGDFLEINLEPQEDYGRVASQTAKQVIVQRLREAERDAMYDEYKEKEGEVVSGIIQRIEGRNVFIDLGKSVGILFPANQSSGDNYQLGRRIKVYVERVESDPHGPGVVLSRSHPNLLAKLFELEVPEIFTGAVTINSIAREAGNRSKIAVFSKEEGIDPIGSCVGQKGTRVQSVIDEIGGEKIDIIAWNDDLEKMISAALSPAKTVKVELFSEKKEAKVYVLKDQFSLAIGKRGQNVRLASKLVGWKISVLEATEEMIEKLEAESKKKDKKEASTDKDAKATKKKKTKKKKEETSSEKEEKEEKKEKKVTKKKKPAKKKTKAKKDKEEELVATDKLEEVKEEAE